MMTKIKRKAALKQVRNHHSDEFKQQAVMRAAQDGVRVVAMDLGLAESQLYAWRARLAYPVRRASISGLNMLSMLVSSARSRAWKRKTLS